MKILYGIMLAYSRQLWQMTIEMSIFYLTYKFLVRIGYLGYLVIF